MFGYIYLYVQTKGGPKPPFTLSRQT